jgi:transposase
MEFKFILGVDISKQWFNFCLMTAQFEILWEGEIENTPEPIFRFLKKLSQRVEVVNAKAKLADIVIVMEHTGIYVQHLVKCYLSKGGRVSLVHASKVSELLGGKQKWDEKTDVLDARRLAEYGIRYKDKLALWQAKEHTIVKLRVLQRQRSRLIDAMNLLEVPVKESVQFDSLAVSELLKTNQEATIMALKNDLKNVEKQLQNLIESDAGLTQLFTLITSVPGVGPVIAREVIITTSAFKDFTPRQAKQFARYAGVTPKDKQSGKMKRSRRTTKRGNKKIKSLLTMGATSLIGTRTDLGLYYQKKIDEQKKHFSVINAMRNKLILRIFAVVRNQVTYEKNMNMCLD